MVPGDRRSSRDREEKDPEEEGRDEDEGHQEEDGQEEESRHEENGGSRENIDEQGSRKDPTPAGDRRSGQRPLGFSLLEETASDEDADAILSDDVILPLVGSGDLQILVRTGQLALGAESTVPDGSIHGQSIFERSGW